MALSTSSYLVVEEVGLPLENHYIVSDSTQYVIVFSGGGSWTTSRKALYCVR
jgi:hypothetical protein